MMQEEPTRSMKREVIKPETISFKEIDRIFEEFRKRQEIRDEDELDRGGTVYSKKRTIVDDIVWKKSDYHVEASFTPVESPCIIRSVSLLNILAADKDSGLAQKIVQNFKKQTNTLFSQALHDGVLDTIREFAQKYSSLLPALDAMFQVAGAEGTSFAVRMCSDLLQSRVANPVNPEIVQNMQIREFTGVHPGDINKPIAYEVWCSGMIFANTILTQSRLASEELAFYVRVNNIPYSTSPSEIWRSPDTKEESELLVRNLYEAERDRVFLDK